MIETLALGGTLVVLAASTAALIMSGPIRRRYENTPQQAAGASLTDSNPVPGTRNGYTHSETLTEAPSDSLGHWSSPDGKGWKLDDTAWNVLTAPADCRCTHSSIDHELFRDRCLYCECRSYNPSNR